jgi:hypothetical protein
MPGTYKINVRRAIVIGVAVAAVGADSTERSVTFRGTDLEIDVEIQEGEAAEARVLLGQLAPPGSAAIEVQRDDSSIAATACRDELDRHLIPWLPCGRGRCPNRGLARA